MHLLAALILLQANVAQPPAATPAPAPAPPAVDKPLLPLLGPGPSRRAIVLAAVKAEWPRYDGGAKGHLTPLEFSTWVLRAHGLAVVTPTRPGRGVPAVKAMNATAAAFALADANHDGGITPEEMTSFLTR